jgi:L-alanine-DL-glutamate epimerase-like enolase superfamily enzyme
MRPMDRRGFLTALSTSASALRAATQTPARITRIRVSILEGRFHKLVAMNAYDKAPKGETYTHPLLRIETDQGIEGIGAGTYRMNLDEYVTELQPLIGKNPLELYEVTGGKVIRPSQWFAGLHAKAQYLDGPLLDLIGKLTNKPVWALLGDSARESIQCYDGTLYFADVMRPDRGVAAVVEEAEEAVRSGFKALKLKLGRGSKWMDRAAGDARDIAVIHAVRKAVGPNIIVMGDANNGYEGQFDGLWRMLAETRDDKLHWIEEPFPESVDGYGRLKDKLAEAKMDTLIADGENFRHANEFEPYLQPRRLMDVLQLDTRSGGLIANREVARMGEAVAAVTIPHNWGSQIGHLMGLHLAKALRAVPLAEDDRSHCDVIVPAGYSLGKGTQAASNEPGLGIHIDAKIYEKQCKPTERMVL